MIKILAVAFWSLVSIFAVQAQEGKSPISCSYSAMPFALPHCDVLTDLSLTGIVLNRGNCQLDTLVDTVPKPEKLPSGSQEQQSATAIYAHVNRLGNYKFGDFFEISAAQPCNLIEITIQTDHGEWTWSLR
jgi:hypothetical protein